MILKLNPKLSRLEVWAQGIELASIMGHDRKNGKRILSFSEKQKELVHVFRNPVLMTDNYRIGQLPPGKRDTLFSLYESRPRIVEYDDVSVSWDNSHKNVWCPSIDTVLFARALKRFIAGAQAKSAVEIGCGSGYLSKYVLAKNRSVRSMLAVDINPYAVKCAMDNIKDRRATFYAGNGLDKINGQQFDLMICNPPYVPRPGSIDDNPYEGIGLLDHLLHEGERYLNDGGVMVVNISSLCHDLVMKEKPDLRYQVIDRMTVPLKVNNIINNKEWIKYLMKKGLKKKLKDGYEYWQDIVIYKLWK